MINYISLVMTEWLQRKGAIAEEDKHLYSYAAYSIIFGLLPLFLAISLGVLFQMVYEGLLLIIPYMLIRKFSGGFHLNSEKQCILVSSILLTTSLAIVKYVIRAERTFFFSLFVIFAAIIIYLCSPADNASRKLTSIEKCVFKKTARILTCLCLIIYFIMLHFSQIRSAIPIGTGLILASVLQLPCIYQTYIT